MTKQELTLKNWLPAVLGLSAVLAGTLYVTGVLADELAGELPTNFHEVKPDNRCALQQGAGSRTAGTIFRGARPDGDNGNFDYLQSIGVAHIVNLETSDDILAESSLIASHHPNFEELPHPMNNGMGVNQLPDDQKNQFGDHNDNDSIIAAVAELRRSSNFPVYIHCHYGDDRTGMTVALHRVFDECWAPKDAESEWNGIAGFFHNLWNFQKHRYFHHVVENANLKKYYEDKLSELVPAKESSLVPDGELNQATPGNDLKEPGIQEE